MVMRVIVTRPARDAAPWVDAMVATGLDAVALPLIAVAPLDDQEPLREAWRRISSYTAVMFVSGNAAEHFFAQQPAAGPVFTAQTAIKSRAWATGPGTVQALMRAGVPDAAIDAPVPGAGQFDSEALWAVVGAGVKPGQRFLIVRGQDGADTSASGGAGRDWFARQLQQAGAQVDLVAAYQRCLPAFGPREQSLAREAAVDGTIWLFSSSQAIANLSALLPAQSWARARAVATHVRIAAAAKRAGFGVVCESRPTLADAVASIESMR
jgi:uroporphyrinogen-III synthase